MKPEKRSRRRGDLERMKARARRLYPHDSKARSAEHLAACSCWMCGNPRRWGEPTLQERKAPAMAVGVSDRLWTFEELVNRTT